MLVVALLTRRADAGCAAHAGDARLAGCSARLLAVGAP